MITYTCNQKVKENIHNFGGDKDQVTIFGESAGSWAVSAQVLSPLSKGYFKGAILESGANFHGKNRAIISVEDSIKEAKSVSKHFNCKDDNKWLDCLRKPNATDFLKFAKTRKPVDGTEFLPQYAQNTFKTVDGYS